MKTRKLTLLFLTMLATIMLGAVAVSVLSPPPTLKLKVKWTPRVYELNNNPPTWNAEIYFAPPRPLDEIDVETIQLEGGYTPVSDPYPTVTSRLVVPFDGYDVLDALMPKLPHMAPGEYRVYLEITGKLFDGTPFSGSGGINVVVPEPSPP